MKWRQITLLSLTIMTFPAFLFGQAEEVIHLNNPSFEDYPRISSPPSGWYDCGFQDETPPDVQPSPNFEFRVKKPAVDGYTYLGMVVRDNDTWEAVSQRLSRPMRKGQCYEFSISLARSDTYLSRSRLSDREVNYTTPAKLRIYGGFGYCDKQFLLAESSLVINQNWKTYNFRFEPLGNYSYLIFEAFYQTPTLFPYNGNILLDNASPIRMVPCDEPPQEVASTEPEPAIAQSEKSPRVDSPPSRPVQPQPEPQTPAVVEADPTPTPPPTPDPIPESPKEEPKKPVVFQGKEIGELKEGTTIRIDKLFFEANKAIIREESYPTLDEVYNFLASNQEVIVEIGGHTNNLPPADICDQLSLERAEAVYKYLIDRGIIENRLQTKGYGKRVPIADNRSLQGRRQNQRVEIKILSIR